MTMQQTHLLMSNIMDRGARVQPDVEVVPGRVRRQTMAETRDRYPTQALGPTPR